MLFDEGVLLAGGAELTSETKSLRFGAYSSFPILCLLLFSFPQAVSVQVHEVCPWNVL